jgi:hypothetical protein
MCLSIEMHKLGSDSAESCVSLETAVKTINIYILLCIMYKLHVYLA